MSQYSEEAVERASHAMCHDHLRIEKMMREKQEIIEKLKSKDFTEFDQFSMKIEQPQREIEVILHCRDPADLVFVAGFVVTALKKLEVEVVIKVLP